MNETAKKNVIGAANARRLEWLIIGFCILALVLIFQPFFLWGFSVGAAAVVLGGLMFNLVPLCRADATWAGLAKVVLIIFAILAAVIAIAIVSALLYSYYLSLQ